MWWYQDCTKDNKHDRLMRQPSKFSCCVLILQTTRAASGRIASLPRCCGAEFHTAEVSHLCPKQKLVISKVSLLGTTKEIQLKDLLILLTGCIPGPSGQVSVLVVRKSVDCQHYIITDLLLSIITV
jgi:hypothetical protein